ncbi:MAG: hypothetical protein [Wendovervirus sonii]|uniref:Uncharacterized protein n=1 Tax=phage Lak_Megaphage_Sonny TaxID=3109229 RepID=A0ABZ0Z5X3_9CAUD|nr:MAG: hypothetical protein [phage Lak_Megaphage_Sonny]
MEILSNINFGDIFETESGKKVVFVGKPFKKMEDAPDYYAFMFENYMELSLYTIDGYGPYAFSVGSGCVFEPTNVDRIKKQS